MSSVYNERYLSKINDHKPKIIDSLVLIATVIASVFLILAAGKERITVELDKQWNIKYNTLSNLGAVYIAAALLCTTIFIRTVIGLVTKIQRESSEELHLQNGEKHRNLEDTPSRKAMVVLGIVAAALLITCALTAVRADNAYRVEYRYKTTYWEGTVVDGGYLLPRPSHQTYSIISIITGLTSIFPLVFLAVPCSREAITKKEMQPFLNKTEQASLEKLAQLVGKTGFLKGPDTDFGPLLRCAKVKPRDVVRLRELVSGYWKVQAQLAKYPMPEDVLVSVVPPLGEEGDLEGTVSDVAAKKAEHRKAEIAKHKAEKENVKRGKIRAKNQASHQEARAELTRLEFTWQGFEFDSQQSVTVQQQDGL